MTRARAGGRPFLRSAFGRVSLSPSLSFCKSAFLLLLLPFSPLKTSDISSSDAFFFFGGSRTELGEWGRSPNWHLARGERGDAAIDGGDRRETERQRRRFLKMAEIIEREGGPE